MADLIDRQALLNGDDVCKVTEYDEAGFSMNYKAVSVEAIQKAPAVDAEPVKHGEWRIFARDMDKRTMLVECSGCDALLELSMIAFGLNYNFCPNCGASMQGESVDD